VAEALRNLTNLEPASFASSEGSNGCLTLRKEGYRDLKAVFEVRDLPRRGQKYASYQLLRDVLAAYALDLCFCVLLDARRLDLIEDWYEILRSIKTSELRSRCKVLTWQGLVQFLPQGLRTFLDLKYGIVPATVAASRWDLEIVF